jgi:glycine reductase complex component B subunit gamma
VQICTITSIALAVGANRILPAAAIPYPLGSPDLSPNQEKAMRRKLVDQALAALQSHVDKQTIFNA